MIFQEGFDMGAVLFPMLIVVGLCFLGLIIWLIIILSRTRNKPGAQSVKQQLSEEQDETLPYILAIRRVGTEWEIYVKGQRANAFNTTYDSITRKEALEALRELARFARDQLRGRDAPTRITPESSIETTLTRPDRSSDASPSTTGSTLFRISRTRPRSTVSTDAPSPSPTVPVMNLKQEIGEIVHELLANTPSLQNHGVDLIDAQTGGINFAVDGVVYKEVDDIPNLEIRKLIRRATKEWESR